MPPSTDQLDEACGQTGDRFSAARAGYCVKGTLSDQSAPGGTAQVQHARRSPAYRNSSVRLCSQVPAPCTIEMHAVR